MKNNMAGQCKQAQTPIIVGAKYKLLKKIGSGSFGVVFHAMNLLNGQELAVKLENNKGRHPQLESESKLYKYLAGPDVPRTYW